MNELDWFRSHVELLLQDIWGNPEIVPDGDGDYPFRFGTAAGWVCPQPGPPIALRVMAHVAHGVKRTTKLLNELNDITARTRFGGVYWVPDVVVCAYAVPAAAVDREVLEMACRMVGSQADELGPMIAAVYGGRTPFEPLEQAEDSSDRETP